MKNEIPKTRTHEFTNDNIVTPLLSNSNNISFLSKKIKMKIKIKIHFQQDDRSTSPIFLPYPSTQELTLHSYPQELRSRCAQALSSQTSWLDLYLYSCHTSYMYDFQICISVSVYVYLSPNS